MNNLVDHLRAPATDRTRKLVTGFLFPKDGSSSLFTIQKLVDGSYELYVEDLDRTPNEYRVIATGSLEYCLGCLAGMVSVKE